MASLRVFNFEVKCSHSTASFGRFKIVRAFFIIAEVCLLVGSVRNAHHTKYRTIFGQDPLYCETLRDGVFATGAALIFLNGIVSELYCVFFSNDSETLESYDGEAAIALIP